MTKELDPILEENFKLFMEAYLCHETRSDRIFTESVLFEYFDLKYSQLRNKDEKAQLVMYLINMARELKGMEIATPGRKLNG